MHCPSMMSTSKIQNQHFASPWGGPALPCTPWRWPSWSTPVHSRRVYLYFQDMQREYVWIFFVLAAVSVLLVIYHMFTWQKLRKEKQTSAPTTCIQHAKAFKANFDMNGKWFLWILYGSEVLESGMQVYNMSTLYTCTLPPGSFWCFAWYWCWTTGIGCTRCGSQIPRSAGTCKSSPTYAWTCCAWLLPLAFMWFGYKIPLTMVEMLLVVC